MHYYKHNIKDFNAHTVHLSRLERDIYRQMIDWYYLTEKSLTGDLAALYRKLCIKSGPEKKAAAQILGEFFIKLDENYTNSRCEEEIEAYQAWVSKSKDGAAKRWHNQGNAKAIATKNNKPLTINHKPSIKELSDYFAGKMTNSEKEAAKFFDYYESKGWMVGSSPMKKWRNAASGWARRNNEKSSRNSNTTKQQRRDTALIQLHSE